MVPYKTPLICIVIPSKTIQTVPILINPYKVMPSITSTGSLSKVSLKESWFKGARNSLRHQSLRPFYSKNLVSGPFLTKNTLKRALLFILDLNKDSKIQNTPIISFTWSGSVQINSRLRKATFSHSMSSHLLSINISILLVEIVIL